MPTHKNPARAEIAAQLCKCVVLMPRPPAVNVSPRRQGASSVPNTTKKNGTRDASARCRDTYRVPRAEFGGKFDTPGENRRTGLTVRKDASTRRFRRRSGATPTRKVIALSPFAVVDEARAAPVRIESYLEFAPTPVILWPLNLVNEKPAKFSFQLWAMSLSIEIATASPSGRESA